MTKIMKKKLTHLFLMTQENKELLLKDLCARLPYKVKCCIYNFGEDIVRIKEDVLWSVQGDNILTLKSCVEKGEAYMYHQIKPYLFPLSSMTEIQCYELASIRSDFQDCWKYIKTPIPLSICNFEQIDWFNRNHLDYRGLIEKGLAIDATGLNIY